MAFILRLVQRSRRAAQCRKLGLLHQLGAGRHGIALNLAKTEGLLFPSPPSPPGIGHGQKFFALRGQAAKNHSRLAASLRPQ